MGRSCRVRRHWPCDMTPQMKACLDLIQNLTIDGVSPSYEQLREGLGLANKSSVHRLVHALSERGYIALLPHRARTIQIINPDAEAIPFDRMAEAVTRLFRQQKTVSEADVRRAIVRAYGA